MAGQDSRQFQLSDYLVIFLSILFGYVVSQFFSGWGSIIRHSTNVKIYWIHLGWTVLVFVNIIEAWWGMWRIRDKFSERISNFFLVLLYPIMLYLLGVVLFPDISNEKTIIFKDYFYSNTFLLFTFMTITIGVSLTVTLLFERIKCFSGSSIARILAIALFAISAFIKYELYHIIFFCLIVVYYIWWIARYRTKPKPILD